MIQKISFLILSLLSCNASRAQNCPLSITASSYSVCPGFQATLTVTGASTYTWSGAGGTVIGHSLTGGAGSYTVEGTSGTCTASAVISIGVAPPLSISVSASSATTCITSNSPIFSKQTTLTASGASSYLWTYPAAAPPSYTLGQVTHVRPPSNSCYTVTGSTSVCSGSAVSCVTVIPQFQVAVTPGQTTICAGNSATLAVSLFGPAPALTYSWTESNGLTINNNLAGTVIVTPDISKTYSVEVRDANNCVSQVTEVSVVVEPCIVGVTGSFSASAVIGPNPARDFVFIQHGAILRNVQVTDLRGAEVMLPVFLEEKHATVQVSDLAPGIYFLRLTFEDGKKSCFRFVKD